MTLVRPLQRWWHPSSTSYSPLHSKYRRSISLHIVPVCLFFSAVQNAYVNFCRRCTAAPV